jgi:hypothetical protein
MHSASFTEAGSGRARAHFDDYGYSGRDHIERLLSWLIFVTCLAYLCLFRRYSTLEPDEGIVLQGAERILGGQLPYRDFFSFYTPGSFYLVAGLFRIFGDSFTVARTSVAVVGALCSVVTYVLARRICSLGVALFTAVLATTAGAAFRFLVLHNVYSTLGCCLCLYAAVRMIETQRFRWALIMGSMASLTFLIEQSKGGGLYLGLIFGFTLLALLDREASITTSAGIAVATGLLWPLVLTFAYFGTKGTAGLMLESWLWPLQHYTKANHVPYGYQNWSDHTRELIFHSGPFGVRTIKVLAVLPGLLVPVLPLLAIGILAYWAAASKRNRRPTSSQSRYYILTCSVLCGLLISVLIVRADILHFLYLAPLWYLVLAWILGSRGVRNSSLNSSRIPLIALVAVSFGLLSMAVLSSAIGATNRIETRRGAIHAGARDTALDYLQTHVHPGGNLLVYPYLPLYNYLSQTRNPSHYDFFQPGMNTSNQAQEIINSLRETSSPVLFEPQFSEKIANSWPGTSLEAFATDPVSEFIASNYRVCRNLTSPENWRFEFMVRKETECP